MHIFEDHFLPEIIDPATGNPLEPGREGELVLTTLTTSAYPLLRYRTSDRTALRLEPCSCGRTLARMDRVLARTDRMITVRGINVFPEKIQEVIASFQEVGPGYSTSVSKKKGMNDQVKIVIEASGEIMRQPLPSR